MRQRILFHVHTKLSIDSNLTREKLLQYCEKNHIDIVVVTDHYAFFSKKIETLSSGTTILPACEFMTKEGDLIGVFFKDLQDEIVAELLKEKNLNLLAKLIHDNDGITILPHPYARHDLDKIDFANIDIMEIHNARYDANQSSQALQLAQKYRKKTIIGADAHLKSELGNALNIKESNAGLRELFFEENSDCQKRYTTVAKRCYSMFLMERRSMRIISAFRFLILAVMNWVIKK